MIIVDIVLENLKCRTQQIGRIKMAVAVVKILAAANLLVERFMRDVNRDFVSTPLCYSVDLVCTCKMKEMRKLDITQLQDNILASSCISTISSSSVMIIILHL